MQKWPGAFILIELLVVITIIAILAGVALPVFSRVQEKVRITQDLSNLCQLGIATRTYLNENGGIIFLTNQATTLWMRSLHPKYLSAWKIFQSPFDGRSFLESDTNSPVSYGLKGNAIALSTDKIQKPALFVLFAPAKKSHAQMKFSGGAGATVTVLRASSTPGGAATGGVQKKRTSINALLADLHSESLSWATFKMDPTGPTDHPSRFR